ncbi:AMP-binding protein [Streptomyces sp. DSM 44917]|uniref:AMP-binding protein n=1 Tax=Streptomyces boetiae TaxID=3075541 RepID=A0ABU2L496_9ACTN|nr:AMP-binding protein [Streptomyces sp. DSM 44917]MDT0306377.1 AMP-binding protein [Streptomyces sp. DSM 44917]
MVRKGLRVEDSPWSPWLRFYPSGVPHQVSAPDADLGLLLDAAARAHPRRTALLFFGRRTSYHALARRIERFADGLHTLGVRPGDRVALLLPNCPQFVVAFFATLRLGAVVVPTDPQYSEHELRRQLDEVGAVAVVAFDGVVRKAAAARDGTRVRHLISADLSRALPPWLRLWLRLAPRLPLARRMRGPKVLRARLAPGLPPGTRAVPFDEVSGDGTAPPWPRVEPDDTAVLQFTGGTTGVPRAAVLTHRNLAANAHQLAAWHAPLEATGTTVAVLPLHHPHGLTAGLGAGLLAGSRTVLLPTLNTGRLLRACRRWSPGVLHATPPVYRALLERPERELEALRSLRMCVSSGQRLPAELVARFEAATHVPLTDSYGLTEAAPLVLANPLNANARPGTAGLPLPGTEVVIAETTEPGQAGELLVRGPQVFAGYWNDPRATEGALTPDGWLRTGDIAVLSPDGFVTLIDRRDDVITVGGLPVFPSEVEDVLAEHPAVQDAVVTGVPHPAHGEVVKAFLTLADGAELNTPQVVGHCTGRLAPYKVPALVEIRTAPLPRSPSGKVLRRALRGASAYGA